jgi:hypothetical protein
MTIVKLEDHYRVEFGDFYKIFRHNDQSWEFKANGLIKEEDLAEALDILRVLKSGIKPTALVRPRKLW